MKIEKGKLYYDLGKERLFKANNGFNDNSEFVTDNIAVLCRTEKEYDYVVCNGYKLTRFVGTGYYSLLGVHFETYKHLTISIDQFKEFYPCKSDISIKSNDIVQNNGQKELGNITPTHYTNKRIQPIDYIEANKLDFNEGNIIKYVTRYKDKNGLEDLKKARFYIERLIELNK